VDAKKKIASMSSASDTDGSDVSSSEEPTGHDIPIEDTDGYRPWYIVRKHGLSPICSICETMLGRIRIAKADRNFHHAVNFLTTTVPVEERAMGGCDLCALFIAGFGLEFPAKVAPRGLLRYQRQDFGFINLNFNDKDNNKYYEFNDLRYMPTSGDRAHVTPPVC
jgi:hypothetical protein